MDQPSIVEYFAEHEKYRCGYCKGVDTNYSHGMWAHQMTCQDYQDLIDRGWRRSGKYCYKPTMNLTCCPHYTIRCDAQAFKMNKSHKKLIKRVNKFLITGVRPGEAIEKDSGSGDKEQMSDGPSKGMEALLAERTTPSDIELPQKNVSSKLESGQDNETNNSVLTKSKSHPVCTSSASKEPLKADSEPSFYSQKHIPKEGGGADPSKPVCRKAKQLRLERKLQKQKSKSMETETIQTQKNQSKEKSLEDFLNEPVQASSPVHKLELRLVRSQPASDLFNTSFNESHTVYHKYQTGIHKDKPDKPNKKQYTRFLCDSPLLEISTPGGPSMGYGSFHQQYVLDGKIIAVGVVDILPSCVSSVYLYYDPDYHFLGLGTYSALREIAFVRELSQQTPALHYYYMGFYLHGCPKMRYKGQYVPSYLSCPESYSWIPIEKCRPKLDLNKYSRLEEEGIEDKDKDVDVNDILCFHKGSLLPYALYKRIKSKGRDEDEVKEYAGFVGKICAERMALVRK